MAGSFISCVLAYAGGVACVTFSGLTGKIPASQRTEPHPADEPADPHQHLVVRSESETAATHQQVHDTSQNAEDPSENHNVTFQSKGIMCLETGSERRSGGLLVRFKENS